MIEEFNSISPLRLEVLDDFWRREQAQTPHGEDFTAYGHPVQYRANHPDLLQVVAHSRRRFSRSAPREQTRPIRLDFLLDSQLPEAIVPEDWPGRLRYHATGDYLTINREPWINAFADLEHRHGVALVSPKLVHQPRLLSRYIADCFILNMMLRTGWGQLHASCVTRSETALLFSARHNTGKSTTAFRLVRHGYGLLSDGMTYVRADSGSLELMGYPVGEVKLRPEMLDEFSSLGVEGDRVLVREATKYVFDLRRWMPERVIDESFRPERAVVCLLERHAGQDTRVESISKDQALAGLWPEALHLDAEERLRRNLAPLRALVQSASCYRLTLGTRVAGILQAVDDL
jgi:hypothetical protein